MGWIFYAAITGAMCLGVFCLLMWAAKKMLKIMPEGDE